MLRRVRESRLDHAFQVATNDTRHGRHFKAGLAELEVSQGEANGADQKENSNHGKKEAKVGNRFPGSLLRDEDQHGRGNQIPESGKYPGGDHAGLGVALDAALGPVFAPQPGLRRMLGLGALLPLQELRAADRHAHQPAPNSAEYHAKNQQQPHLGVAGAREHLGDRPGESEQTEAGKGQREQADEYRSEFGGAVHS